MFFKSFGYSGSSIVIFLIAIVFSLSAKISSRPLPYFRASFAAILDLSLVMFALKIFPLISCENILRVLPRGALSSWRSYGVYNIVTSKTGICTAPSHTSRRRPQGHPSRHPYDIFAHSLPQKIFRPRQQTFARTLSAWVVYLVLYATHK